MEENLAERDSDIDRWPDDEEWRAKWIDRVQYGPARQARLSYIFEMIEKELRSDRNEEIEIKSALTIEHILPQKWKENWVLPGYEDGEIDETDIAYRTKMLARNHVVNTLGNLTLLTQKLNSSVSNGAYAVKMPAIRAHSSLALNRDLNFWNHWDEETIRQRSENLFKAAKNIWAGPTRKSGFVAVARNHADFEPKTRAALPEDGTKCEFTYGSKVYNGEIVSGEIVVTGFNETFATFSGASKAITKTSRNGWNDWHIEFHNGKRMLADAWRKCTAGET